MKCPYCAEEIKDEAVICRYCSRDLTSIRLHLLENTVKQRLAIFESNQQILLDKIAQLEIQLGSLPINPITRERVGSSKTSLRYGLAFVVGGLLPISSVYFYFETQWLTLLLIPFLVFLGLGVWVGMTDPQRSVQRYFYLGLAIGGLNFVGLIAVILRVVYNTPLLTSIFGFLYYSHDRDWGWTPLLLFATPFFLVMLGGFVGEWLESQQPSGRKIQYPAQLAEQLVRFSNSKPQSKVELENLSNLLAAVAPLIAALGGIAVPIITALLR